MDHSLPGILWGLTRLQVQCEAVIAALDRSQPGFHSLVAEEMKKIWADGRILQIFAENKREVDQASDSMWLKSHGIDPEAEAT